MEAGAARNDAHGFGPGKDGLCRRSERSLQQLAAGHALLERLRDGARLLVDFLQHVVREVALLRGIGREFALVHLALDRIAVLVQDAVAVAADLADVAFLEEDEPARHRQQRSHVGGDEVLTITEADDDRAALARKDEALGFLLRYHGQRIRTFELGNGRADRLEQVARLLQVVVNAVSDHFGVGLGRELVAGSLQFRAQLFVVFDDAVVDERDAVPGDVRVRIALARHAVRGPAGVRYTEQTARGVRIERILQHANLADRA